MTLRMERSAELHAVPPTRVEPCPALLVPIDTSVVLLTLGDAPSERVDRASFALVPAHTPYRVDAKSTVTTLATMLVASGARESACREYRPYVDARRFGELLATPRLLPRTRWFDEIVHRYVFERDVCAKHGSAAATFLETEIAKELYFLCAERAEMRRRTSVVREEGDVVARARARLDDNLFVPLHVGELARQVGASESTLLRAFQRELGQAPAAYARERRLDAALLLLQSGRHSVGEVASRVGYASLAAFTAAFTRRFGRAPSSVRRTDDALELLPPHGKPPQAPRAKRRKRKSL
jgi:AraC-like DNA-binding protein